MNMLAKPPARCWWYLMPTIFITYSLTYLDRANYGFAAAAGIEHDLGVTQGTASLTGALFFPGYSFFQVPGAMYAVKHSVREMILYSLVLWGPCAMTTGFVSNIPTLMAIRFILGIVEVAVMPAMLIYIGNWFTRTERSRTSTFLILDNPVTVLWMSIISGYLIEAWGWHEMLITEGIPTVIWAFCWVILVRGKPADAGWLSEQEKQALQQAMDREQRDIKPMHNYGEAMRSRSITMLCAMHVLWGIGVYGFMMWTSSTLENAAQTDIVAVGWLAAVPYLAVVCLMLTVSWLSDKFQNRKLFIWPLLLIAAIVFSTSWLLGNQSFWLSYVLLVVAAACMYTPYGPFFALIPGLLPRNVSSMPIEMISSLGALGAFLGAWLVGYLNGVTDGPGVSYTFMVIALLASVVLMHCVHTQNETTPPSAEIATR